MSLVSPLHDASAAGCLANASLSAAGKPEIRAARQTACFTASPMRAEAPAPPAPACRTRSERLFDALFSLVSGPAAPKRG